MPTLHLATWNVLHRVHAENYDEGVVTPYPDEAARAAAIANRVAEVMADGVAVLCLQEVSGDQRDAFRRVLPPGTGFFELAYPRRPQPRRPHVGRLRDATELLVTVVAPGMAAETMASLVFPDDPGKGFLGVRVAGALAVFNTHVSFGERCPGQLARLAAAVRSGAVPAAVLGDFNAGVHHIAAGLGTDFVPAALPPDALPTRPRSKPDGKDQHIDHVFARAARVGGAQVLPAHGLSDHNLVRATVEAG
ncbi:endonuclease/exonuclease/phosphatase family protein [Myxococcota bacterium]|nr:endonuclease/exonuclease/phosphatase family protein [Myxococcota bacterium]